MVVIVVVVESLAYPIILTILQVSFSSPFHPTFNNQNPLVLFYFRQPTSTPLNPLFSTYKQIYSKHFKAITRSSKELASMWLR
ncbi:hypothetical protein Hanom_Chr00s012668g01749791 [Helianthus anomalus]